MDKYQIFVLKNAGYGIWLDEKFKERTDRNDGKWSIILDTENVIRINQSEDYNITKYLLRFQETVSKVIVKGKEYLQQAIGNTTHKSVVVPIDFNDRVEEIEIHFHDVIDPMMIKLEYIESDHKTFDEKVEKERQSELISNACIKVSTGADLVNIYFQPCCDSYERSAIELYLANGTYTQAPSVMGKHDVFHPQLISATPGQLIGKFKVDDGMMFKSITGLAKGAYGYILYQYDENGNLLFKTECNYFDIQ